MDMVRVSAVEQLQKAIPEDATVLFFACRPIKTS